MDLNLTWTNFNDSQKAILEELCRLLIDQGFTNNETNVFTLYNEDNSYMVINILKDHISINKQRWINSKYINSNYNFIEAHLNVAKSGIRLKDIIDNLILSKEADEDKNIKFIEIVRNMFSILKKEYGFAELYDSDCQTNRMRKLKKHDDYSKSTLIFNYNKLHVLFIFEGNSEHKSNYLPIDFLMNNTVEQSIDTLLSFKGENSFSGINGLI